MRFPGIRSVSLKKNKTSDCNSRASLLLKAPTKNDLFRCNPLIVTHGLPMATDGNNFARFDTYPTAAVCGPLVAIGGEV